MPCICSICLGSLTEDPTGNSTIGPATKMAKPSDPTNTVQLVAPRCGHVFHRSCLTAWFATGNNICPSCRKICGQNALKPVFLSASEPSSSTTVQSETPSETRSKLKKAVDQTEALSDDLDEFRGDQLGLQHRYNLLTAAHNKAAMTTAEHRLTIQQLEASKKDITKLNDRTQVLVTEVRKRLAQQFQEISKLIVDHLKLRKEKEKDESLQTNKPHLETNEQDGDGDDADDDFDHDEITTDEEDK